MRATGLGVVIAVGQGSSFKPGDRVIGRLGALCSLSVASQLELQLAGMTEYAVMEDNALTKIEYVLFYEIIELLR